MSCVFVHGGLLSLVASAFVLVTLRINPRIQLQDYPRSIQDLDPPKSAEERAWSLTLGVTFLVLLTFPLCRG
jgi:hypothetical protein